MHENTGNCDRMKMKMAGASSFSVGFPDGVNLPDL